jgi:hypothetical protein
MFKKLILPKFSSEGYERYLKFKNIILRSFFSTVSHKRTELSVLWDTTEKILLQCGIQWKKNSSTVGYNGRKTFAFGIQRKKICQML